MKDQLEADIINIGSEVFDLMHLTKRIAYFCPIEYISDPFFILYFTNKDKVEEIQNMIKNILKESDTNLSQSVTESLDSSHNEKDQSNSQILQRATSVADVSDFLFNNPESDNIKAQLRQIFNYPFKLEENPNLAKYAQIV